MDNISFNGGFLIRKPKTATKWDNIEKLLPKKKCIIKDFNENGDMFVAIKTHYDEYTLDLLLKKKKVNIVFYPDINLKTRLDAYFPEEARDVVGSQVNVIRERKGQLKYLNGLKKKHIVKNEFVPGKYKWTPEDHVDKTLSLLNKLGIDTEGCKVFKENGITIIKNKSGKKIAFASPNSGKGVNYVYILPKNTDESPKRFAINQSGETEEFYGLSGMKNFQENFKKAVNFDLCRKRPNKA